MRTTMLTMTKAKETMIVSPGTDPWSVNERTSLIASMAWANVPAKTPIANWLGRSRRNGRTARGENWPMANWTTTIVIVSTRAVSDTMDAATVERMMRAALGSPVSVRETSSPPAARSMAIVTEDRTTPASTHITGTNHRLVFNR
jgi:hypothetical protein